MPRPETSFDRCSGWWAVDLARKHVFICVKGLIERQLNGCAPLASLHGAWLTVM